MRTIIFLIIFCYFSYPLEAFFEIQSVDHRENLYEDYCSLEKLDSDEISNGAPQTKNEEVSKKQIDSAAMFAKLDSIKRGDMLVGKTRMQKNEMVDFELEVISISFSQPKEASILAEIKDELFVSTGVLAGMSGSPVYAEERLVGAIAFTVPNLKKPIVGITPIEQMLRVKDYLFIEERMTDGKEDALTGRAKKTERLSQKPMGNRMHDISQRASYFAYANHLEPIQTPVFGLPNFGLGESDLASLNEHWQYHFGASPRDKEKTIFQEEVLRSDIFSSSQDSYHLLVLKNLAKKNRLDGFFGDATNVHSHSKYSPQFFPNTMARFSKGSAKKDDVILSKKIDRANQEEKVFSIQNEGWMQPRGSQYGLSEESFKKLGEELVPGDLIGVNLMRGDLDITAYGTVTHKEGNLFYAFGHQYENAGANVLPIFKAYVDGVVPRTDISYKVGSTIKEIGYLCQDRDTAIVGVISDKKAPTVPIRVTLATSDNQLDFNFQIADHPNVVPLMSAIATYSAFNRYEGVGSWGMFSYELEFVLKKMTEPSLAFQNQKDQDIDSGGLETSDEGESDSSKKISMDQSLLSDNLNQNYKKITWDNVLPYNLLQNGIQQFTGMVYSLLTAMYQNPFDKSGVREVSVKIKPSEQRFLLLEGARIKKDEWKIGQPIEISLFFREYLGDSFEQKISYTPPPNLKAGMHTVEIMNEHDFLARDVLTFPERYGIDDFQSLLERLAINPKRNKLVLYQSGSLSDIKAGGQVYNKMPFLKSVRLARVNQSQKSILPSQYIDVRNVPLPFLGAAKISFYLQD